MTFLLCTSHSHWVEGTLQIALIFPWTCFPPAAHPNAWLVTTAWGGAAWTKTTCSNTLGTKNMHAWLSLIETYWKRWWTTPTVSSIFDPESGLVRLCAPEYGCEISAVFLHSVLMNPWCCSYCWTSAGIYVYSVFSQTFTFTLDLWYSLLYVLIAEQNCVVLHKLLTVTFRKRTRERHEDINPAAGTLSCG